MELAFGTGGTFTDLVLLDEAGVVHPHKMPSTPDDPSRAVLRGGKGAIYARSEHHMRRAIREVPNGVYHAEMALDGVTGDVTLRAAMHGRNDSIHAD